MFNTSLSEVSCIHFVSVTRVTRAVSSHSSMRYVPTTLCKELTAIVIIQTNSVLSHLTRWRSWRRHWPSASPSSSRPRQRSCAASRRPRRQQRPSSWPTDWWEVWPRRTSAGQSPSTNTESTSRHWQVCEVSFAFPKGRRKKINTQGG